LDIVKPVREQTCNVWLIAVVETINGQCLLFALSRLTVFIPKEILMTKAQKAEI